MGKIFLWIFLIFTLLFIGCKDNDENPVQPSSNNQSIIPLKIGNSWTYKVTTFDENGNILHTWQDIRQIEKDTLIQNEKWFFYYYEWRCSRSDGIYSYKPNTSKQYYLEYKYPGNVNETYSLGYITVTIISTNQNITVPKGNFVTYKYRFLNPTDEYEYDYLSPNIGPVLMEYYSKNQSGNFFVSIRWELVDYSIS